MGYNVYVENLKFSLRSDPATMIGLGYVSGAMEGEPDFCS